MVLHSVIILGRTLMILRTCQVLWRLVCERTNDGKFAMDLQD